LHPIPKPHPFAGLNRLRRKPTEQKGAIMSSANTGGAPLLRNKNAVIYGAGGAIGSAVLKRKLQKMDA
jgi:FlaA1/EpsC-like NDP-sugar epimerase